MSGGALIVDLRSLVDQAALSGTQDRDGLDTLIRWILSHYTLPSGEDYFKTAMTDHLCILPRQDKQIVTAL